MSTVLPDAPTVNPNLDAIHGLRDIADFLAMHPELPPFFFGSIVLRAREFEQKVMPPRVALARLARALDDAAVETANSHEVRIEGEIGGITIRASISLKDAGAWETPPPTPNYEPIIARKG